MSPHLTRPSWTRGVRLVLVTTVAASLALVGCARGPDDAGTSGPGTAEQGRSVEDSFPEGMVNTAEEGTPKQGGTLTWAAIAEPRSFDPAQTIAAPTTGGMEMINIFDTLARYDTESGQIVPQLAQDIEANDDASEYTITLRDGVEFSDGTPLDAAAVVWSLERYQNSPQAPEGILWNENVASVTATDERTVSISLKAPFPHFPNLLSTGPGMIVAKSSDAGEAFPPIGAGPFIFETHAPGEEIVLVANPNYWNGAPHLDRLRIVALGSQQAGLDSLATGQVQAVLLSEPSLIQQRLDEGKGGYLQYTSSWGVVLVNASEGRPGADPRVRRAMALAVDPQLIADRAWKGSGDTSGGMFSDASRWHTPDSGQNTQDVAEATRLLDEAKADGYDGRFTYQYAASTIDAALALKAQWETVGFQVELDELGIADLLGKLIGRDYDTSQSGINLREFDPYAKINAALRTGGTQTFGMSVSPERDQLIDDLKVAADDAQMKEALSELEANIAQEVPYIPHVHSWEMTTWESNVHGANGAASSMILWDKAWID